MGRILVFYIYFVPLQRIIMNKDEYEKDIIADIDGYRGHDRCSGRTEKVV